MALTDSLLLSSGVCIFGDFVFPGVTRLAEMAASTMSTDMFKHPGTVPNASPKTGKPLFSKISASSELSFSHDDLLSFLQPKASDGPSSKNGSTVHDLIADDTKPAIDDVKAPLSDADVENIHTPLLSVNITSSRLAKECENLDNPAALMDEKCPPALPPVPPFEPLEACQLHPQTPSVLVDSTQDAYSLSLVDFCLRHPIVVIRGICQALNMDLSLYSTKTLVETAPDHSVEIRTQISQDADENVDVNTGKRAWVCESSRAHTTVAKYAQYQAASFVESLNGPVEGTGGSDSEGTSTASTVKSPVGSPLATSGRKCHKFGTNVDLSDPKKWRAQLEELNKLPPFFRVSSAGNMLTHVGHTILGMNTVQLYMKVPSSRTPGHQENNNYCSVNINIGPGDCIWFGVPESYWGAIYGMCQENKVDYLHGSWWPLKEDLEHKGIPVYQFTQKPGELVWINSGCVHWVQASGWCNNIAWNVGPLTARQFLSAVERYEWNKLQHYKSIVPVVHLTWNLARNIKVSELQFYQAIKYALLRSLRTCQLTLRFLKVVGCRIKFHGRGKNEPTHYCGSCDIEVFNFLLIKIEEKKHVVHCINCARKISPRLEGFLSLQEYTMEELASVCDSFTMRASQNRQLKSASYTVFKRLSPYPSSSHRGDTNTAGK